MDPVSVPGSDDPRRLLASVYTATVTVSGLALASIALGFGRAWVAAGVGVAVVVALALGDRVRGVLAPGEAVDPETARHLEDLRRLYARGEIGDEEYERRFDAAVAGDPEAVWGDTPSDGAPDRGATGGEDHG